MASPTDREPRSENDVETITLTREELQNLVSEGRPLGVSPNRVLSALILIAIVIVVGLVGFFIIDTILAIRNSTTAVPNAVATEFDQVLNPTPTIIADAQTVVRQIQTLSQLTTISYTIEKVITAESGEGPLGFLFRDRLLLVAQGEVRAGVDLSRIGEDDIQVVGTSVFVTVPASEIFVATLNNDETYVYDRETAVLGQTVDLETLARQAAEEEILQAALEDGILDQAQENAEDTLEGLLRALGFEEVVFVEATPAPGQDRGE
ncbi:MAG: DUF4230 domain-containing protein [Chloroflexi bacterium]|nr:DUF4230 domain-containing protein [Chloroflexota bacterium]